MNYLFMSLKRSGQHAIVNWLAQQTNHNVLHYNNCIKGWEQKRLLPMKNHMVVSYIFNGKNHEIKNYFVDHKIDLNKSEQLRQEFENTQFTNIVDNIYNIEDLSFEQYDHQRMWEFEEVKDNCKNILIMRDPYNFIASCLQRLVDPPDAGATDVGKELPSRLKIWKKHANQVLKGNETSQPFYFISYNEWFSSPSYRKKICDDLNLVFTDSGMNKVMNFGNGSSFDREKFDGTAQKMNVLTRYHKWQNHRAFQHLIDDEIKFMAQEIFAMSIGD